MRPVTTDPSLFDVALRGGSTPGSSPVGRALAAAAERRHGLLTVDDLHAAGLDGKGIHRWLMAGRLVAMARGVYRVGGAPPSPASWVLAAVLVHGARTWASHRTAAWWWGVPGFGRPGRVELTRDADRSNGRAGAIVHRTGSMPSHHHTVRDAIPVTTLSRTMFDLAGCVGPFQLDRAVEWALRTPWCSIGGLHRVTEELGGRGRTGTKAMRTQLHARGRDYVPTESELDVLGRAVVASIPGIDWQVEVCDERGYIRRVDGIHRGSGLIIEWDGAEFHDGDAQRALDEEGDRRLALLGLRVVRYRWVDVTEGADRVRAELRRLIAERSSDRFGT
jgi:hypothetical protein